MRPQLCIVFGSAEVVVDLGAADPLPAADQARCWLDEQFIAHGCQPQRLSGKVLAIDKLLALATAIGQRGFEQDAAMRLAFARNAVAALGRPLVRIDVDARSVSC